MRSDEKGMALMVVLMTGLIVTLIAAYALNLSYNQKRQLSSLASSRRTNFYYWAQAGVVDAMWRIRKNIVPPGVSAGSGSTSFTNAAYDPAPYYINFGGGTAATMYTSTQQAASEVKVDIGPVDATTKQRKIVSTGIGK